MIARRGARMDLVDRSPYLQTVADEGGLRHVLDGRSVHAGSGLEVRMADGTWAKGVYEWTFELNDAPVLLIEGVWGEVRYPLPRDAVLRWPAQPFSR